MNSVNSESQIEIAIEGMDCASCASGIERALKRVGFSDVSVNFASHAAYVVSSDTHTAFSAVAEIKRLGYSARLRDRTAPDDEDGQSAYRRRLLYMAIFCSVLTAPILAPMLFPLALFQNPWTAFALSTPVVALGFLHFGKSAFASLRSGLPNMDVLIVVGVAASYFYSLAGILLHLGDQYLYFETAAAIVTLVFAGNFLEAHSVEKASAAIRELSRAQVAKATRVRNTDGREIIEEIAASAVEVGDILRVNSGDTIPADGRIASGELLLDESIVTGESAPQPRGAGADVIGGSVVDSGSALITATQVGERTVLSGILRLVHEAQGKKPSIQRIGDVVSAYFTPCVISISLLTFAIWYVAVDASFRDALLSSVAVLVIACPCAMGLATPTAVMVGIGRGAKHGILIRGGAVIEKLAAAHFIIFDKTGTLTTGNFSVQKLEPVGVDEQIARSLIVGLEQKSSHPIAKSLLAAYSDSAPFAFASVEEKKGFGMSAVDASGARYSLGFAASDAGVSQPRDGRLVLAKNGEAVAFVTIADTIKEDAHSAILSLRKLGLTPVLLSGDSRQKCELIAGQLGIERVFFEQTPEQKLTVVEQLLLEGSTVFVGDGINDAPALARATVGVAMGNGAHLAIRSADIVLLHGRLDRLVEAVELSRATLSTIRQNLSWAFSYNLIAIPVAAFGILNPMLACFAMGFSDVMTIGNSLRLRSKKLPTVSR